VSYDQTKPCKYCGVRYNGWTFHSGGHVEENCRNELYKQLEALRAVGRALASHQPACHATTQEEADLWAKFYALLDSAPDHAR
jgi:hypothetical protein